MLIANNNFLLTDELFVSISLTNFPQSPQTTNQATLYPRRISMILRIYTKTLASIIKVIQISSIFYIIAL